MCGSGGAAYVGERRPVGSILFVATVTPVNTGGVL